jgi:colicin import membrane protein
MSRPGVTRDQVFEAADTLLAEGRKPTVKLVRERIGGSFSTITPHLAEWKDARAGASGESAPEMPAPVAAASQVMWVSAWNAGQEVLRAEREALALVRRELEQERTDLAREIADLEEKADAAASERDALAIELQRKEAVRLAAEQDSVTLRMENARLVERVANTEKRAEELRKQVERMERELARLAGQQAAAPTAAGKKAPRRPRGGAASDT